MTNDEVTTAPTDGDINNCQELMGRTRGLTITSPDCRIVDYVCLSLTLPCKTKENLMKEIHKVS